LRNYFYKINKKYIESFSNRIFSRFRQEDIKTNNSFLKSILTELNNLFKFIGGKVSTKDDIPKPTDYPDSEKFNKLITDINDDIQKIFTSQKLIEDDVNNLLNFNSTQRTKTFENLTSVQQLVYSIYIKNKKGINGEVIVPSSNPFESSDNMSEESSNIYIDQTRGVLTLDCVSDTQKTTDLENINIFFAGKIPFEPIYPNNKTLGVGHHWKMSKVSPVHFINTKNRSEVLNYKSLMEDDPANNLGVGWCEFESVKTHLVNWTYTETKKSNRLVENNDGSIIFNTIETEVDKLYSLDSLKKYIGEIFNKDSQLIYLDANNSLQGQYINQSYNIETPGLTETPQYKLVIPFKSNTPITNEIAITFFGDAFGYYPKIIWNKSLVYSNQQGSDLSYNLIAPSDTKKIPENGLYSCLIQGGFIKPTRLELFLEYDSDKLHWYPIDFYMSHYIYNSTQDYSLEYDNKEQIMFILGKSYDIFVDSEADQENEKARALNVLLSRGR